MLTFVYGPAQWSLKESFWNSLQTIANSFVGPWLCMEDFNSLVHPSEKMGGNPVDPSASNGLGKFMRENGLVDLGCQGNPFTWVNGRVGQAHIRERLDRGISNGEWRLFFSRASCLV